MVPPLQKRIVETSRRLGRPVVVATQMLESMITEPVADPRRGVGRRHRDLRRRRCDHAFGGKRRGRLAGRSGVDDERDRRLGGGRSDARRPHPLHRHPPRSPPPPTRLAEAAKSIASTDDGRRPRSSASPPQGSTARRVARERPPVPILVLTPSKPTLRAGSACCGAPMRCSPATSNRSRTWSARPSAWRCARGIAKAGDRVIVMAGVPFKTPGSTNVLHIVSIVGDELKGYS